MTPAISLRWRWVVRIITNPAAMVAALAGLAMIFMLPSLVHETWLWVKLAGVAGLAAYHIFAIVTYRRFSVGDYFLSEKACRFINEVPRSCFL